MVVASQVRPGIAIRFENHTYKVLAAEYQAGQGKMGGVLHARLKNLDTGTTWEHGFRADLKLEEIPLDRRAADFLYNDGDQCCFMDPENFEQYLIPGSILGSQKQLLTPEMRVDVEFLEDRPVSVRFPDVLELRIAETAPPLHGTDGAWKPARLENGVEIMVPPFIKTNDVIRLHVAELKYMDRVKGTAK